MLSQLGFLIELEKFAQHVMDAIEIYFSGSLWLSFLNNKPKANGE